MGNFQGGGRGGFSRGGDRGGRPSFGGKSRFGGGDRGDRGDVTMHKATCSQCKKTCEVPFRPTGDKPVYCKECFDSMRGEGDRGEKRDFARSPKREFSERSNSRFDDRAPQRATSQNENSDKHLREISLKIDRLIESVEKLASSIKSTVRDEGVKESVAKAVASTKPKAKAVKKKK